MSYLLLGIISFQTTFETEIMILWSHIFNNAVGTLRIKISNEYKIKGGAGVLFYKVLNQTVEAKLLN